MVREIVVIDGGSTDGTQDIAAAFGARVLAGEKGRGQQLADGAAVAMGDWLLFLHADTRLQPGWEDVAAAFIRVPESKRKAGYFRFHLDDTIDSARRLERIVGWRCRQLGLPYGDQGLLLHRSLYEQVGGFRRMPLMEDVDFVRRIGRRRLEMLEAVALTSAARYRRDGYWRRSARNLCLLSLFLAGVPPRLLVRAYG